MASLTVTHATTIYVSSQRVTAVLAIMFTVHTHPSMYVALVILAQARYDIRNISTRVSIHDLLSALVEASFVELRTCA